MDATYHADLLAARLSGSDAFQRMLIKLYLAGHFFSLLRKYVTTKRDGELFHDFRSQIEDLPPRELQRLELLSENEKTGLDSTHPPTPWRRALVSSKASPEPSFGLSDSVNDGISSELQSLEEGIERRLFDDYRLYLYA